MVYNLWGSWKNVNFLKGSDLIKLLGVRLAQWLLKFIQILSSLIFWEYLKLFKVLKIALVYVLNFGWSSSPNLARYWSSSRRYHQRDLSEPLGSVLHPFCAKIPSKLTTKEPSPGPCSNSPGTIFSARFITTRQNPELGGDQYCANSCHY